MVAEWLRQGDNTPPWLASGIMYERLYEAHRIASDQRVESVNRRGSSMFLVSFTLDSMGSNPVHSIKSFRRQFFL